MTNFRCLTALTIITAVAACDVATPLPFESSLTRLEAGTFLRESPNSSRQAYGLRQLQKMVDRGDERAMLVIAGAYRRGRGVEADPIEAVRYYEMASELGNVTAKRILTRYYLDDSLSLYNPARAAELYSELETLPEGEDDLRAFAELSNDPEGALYDPMQAVELYSQLNASGDENAWLPLSLLYLDDESPAYDPQAGLAVLVEQTQKGNGDAYVNLGRESLRGNVVEQDLEQANDYFQLGAAAGSVRAELQVAISQVTGRGMVADRDAGIESLYRIAREADHAGALLLLIQYDAPEYYVAWVQEKLAGEGAYNGPFSGDMDAATAVAVTQWCGNNGVTLDCTVASADRNTVVALIRSFR